MYHIAKKGSHAILAAHSCKEINDLGEAQGNGEYWIDPENTGKPFTVYCDMTTDSGYDLFFSFNIHSLHSIPFFIPSLPPSFLTHSLRPGPSHPSCRPLLPSVQVPPTSLPPFASFTGYLFVRDRVIKISCVIPPDCHIVIPRCQ